MVSEIVKYVINVDEVDQKLMEYAKEHINENPDTNLQIVSDFRDFIYERGECSPHRMDDAFLLRFLRAREFIIQRAHRLLVNYCNYRDNNKELYNIDYKRFREYQRKQICVSMPFCDAENRRICIFRPGIWNPEEVSQQDILQHFVFALEVAIWEPRSQITGFVGIFDLSDTSLTQALYLTPSNITKMFHLLVWSFPLRTHKIHVVNETPVFNIGIRFVKPFLSSETQNFIIFHGNNMSSLHEHISPKYLPERYGGIHPDYNDTTWLDLICSHKHLQEELEKTGFNLDEESDDVKNKV